LDIRRGDPGGDFPVRGVIMLRRLSEIIALQETVAKNNKEFSIVVADVTDHNPGFSPFPLTL
jgi:hypothetical protein